MKTCHIFQFCFVIVIIPGCFIPVVLSHNQNSFTVDYENNCFLKDGKPFRYISGSMHYFRVPQAYWKDRMMKMKAAGLNTLQTYIEWSSHELEPGIYNFANNSDFVTFLKTAQEVGLFVILRPGPYICAEREFGGLPYWLMREKPNIRLRTSDPSFLYYLDKWFGLLLSLIKPLLYVNGGPIILIQVENEYGEFGCDYEYLIHLRNLLRNRLGNQIVLFRTDMPDVRNYRCDNIDDVLVSADFGPNQNVSAAFHTVRLFQQNGPLTVSEYYAGWMDTWGKQHFIVDVEEVCNTLDEILAWNASVNFYMFHGGTNFGFTNGANPRFNILTTSYDYSACLSEAGDPTELYFKIRNVIGKYVPLPPNPPVPSPKLTLNQLQMKFMAPLLDAIHHPGVSNPIFSKYPKTFEEMGQAYGFCAYSALIDFIPTDPVMLNANGLHDRGYVFVENDFVGILSRDQNAFSLPIHIQRSQKITILVENQGRLDSATLDFKGLTSNVTLGNHILRNWVIQQIPLNDTTLIFNLDKLFPPGSPNESDIKLPGFFSANFIIPNGTDGFDSFLNVQNWSKGIAFINGFNLGRYWPVVGPQVTLYVPGVLFHSYPHQNTLILLEQESAPCHNETFCTVQFVNKPILNGPTPDV